MAGGCAISNPIFVAGEKQENGGLKKEQRMNQTSSVLLVTYTATGFSNEHEHLIEIVDINS